MQLLMDQIEFANVILINKVDLLAKELSENGGKGGSVEERLRGIRALIEKLNPKARVIVPDAPRFEDFDAGEIIDTGLFDMEEAQESAGWKAEVSPPLNRSSRFAPPAHTLVSSETSVPAQLEKPVHTPETEEYGISSFVFRNAERPFHPERLGRIMKDFGTGLAGEIAGKSSDSRNQKGGSGPFAGVVRCKGELWLSSADAVPIEVHSAGRQLEMEPAGNGRPWLAKVLERHPNGDPDREGFDEADGEVWAGLDLDDGTVEEARGAARGGWSERFGDRSSEVVFIGINLRREGLEGELRGALLTDEELNVPAEERRRVWCDDLDDPFFGGQGLWDLEDVMGDEVGDDEEEEG